MSTQEFPVARLNLEQGLQNYEGFRAQFKQKYNYVNECKTQALQPVFQIIPSGSSVLLGNKFFKSAIEEELNKSGQP